ncbi:MAG: deoxycytidylate deaminase [Fusobacteriaceae bacterium]
MTDKQYLDIADIIAKTSHCGRRQVGAVIVKGGRIISTGYNGIPSSIKKECYEIRRQEALKEGYIVKGPRCIGCDNVIHAEQNAIFAAAKEGISLKGSHLYINLSPCITCAKAIAMAGITKVTFKNSYKGDPGIPYLKSLGVEVERWYNE